MPKKLTDEFVRNYFKEQMCKLLEPKYINNHTLMDYICSCGNESKISWDNFKQGHRCKKCGNKKIAEKRKLDIEYVKQNFEEEGCKLLEKTYINSSTLMDYICSCGNESKISWDDFKQGQRCKKCGSEKSAEKRKLDIEYVKQNFKDNNCELLEDTYIDNNIKMKYRCSCGNKSFITWNNFQKGHRCKKCGNKKNAEKHSGKNNYRWNPDREVVETNKKIKTISHSLIYHTLKYLGMKKLTKSELLLKYTRKQLLEHLEKFELDFKRKDVHVDHYFPINAFTKNGIENIDIINSLDNLRPILAIENFKKSNKYDKEEFKKFLENKNIFLEDIK